MIHLLTFTSLYPNAVQPRHGVFVEERLRHLVDSGGITATVIAPVPWFPFKYSGFGTYALLSTVPEYEERYGIRILHPRYPVIPKVGMGIAPYLMYQFLLPLLRKHKAGGVNYDLIDAHYFYPDGVAAVRLGQILCTPVVVTARGTDINLIPHYRIPRRKILWAAEHATAIVTVSQALKNTLIALGVKSNKLTVLRNGVDLSRFRPLERSKIRNKYGLNGPIWLSVGHLVELKGLHITISALTLLPDVTLLIVGDGPEAGRLRRLAHSLGVGERVCFLGAIAHTDLCEYYNAADAVVLASSREGMPNVVLEALACGTPVIATRVGGTPELITSPEAGELTKERSSEALALAWNKLQGRKTDRLLTRKFAERFEWAPTVQVQKNLYRRVISESANSKSSHVLKNS